MALKHHPEVGEMITERDEAALKFLTSVESKPLSDEADPSFVLEFRFKENPFFDNTLLSKSFHLREDEKFGDTIYERSER